MPPAKLLRFRGERDGANESNDTIDAAPHHRKSTSLSVSFGYATARVFTVEARAR